MFRYKKILVFIIINIFSFGAYAEYTKSIDSVKTDYDSSEYPDYDLDDVSCTDIKDPFEKVNRKFFAFNSFLDYVLLQPVARSYTILVPDRARTGASNFLENLTLPVTTINNIIQLKPRESARSVWRFIINTTVGIGGIFDVASKIGLKADKQTFGSTLARYGVKSGPYLVVPFFGSTNGRDITDIFVLNKMDPIYYNMNSYQRKGYTGASMVSTRADLLPVTDAISREAVDPYASIRSLTHQRREGTLRYPASMKGTCAN